MLRRHCRLAIVSPPKAARSAQFTSEQAIQGVFQNEMGRLLRPISRPISMPSPGDQNENCAWKSSRRFAADPPKNPPPLVIELKFPNCGEPRLETGGAKFTLLNRLRALTLKVRLYRRLV